MFVLVIWFSISFYILFASTKLINEDLISYFCSQTLTHPWWSRRKKKEMNIWYEGG